MASACASGSDGIGTALMMLRTGMIDAAVAGAAETTITSTGVAAFDRVGAMSRHNDDYSMTPQPFDKNQVGVGLNFKEKFGNGFETNLSATAIFGNTQAPVRLTKLSRPVDYHKTQSYMLGAHFKYKDLSATGRENLWFL